MRTVAAATETHIQSADKPLLKLLQRPRRSKRTAAADEPAESEPAYSAYERLRRMVGG